MSYKDALQSYIKSAQSRQRTNALNAASFTSSVGSMLQATSNPVGSRASAESAAGYNPAGAKSGSNFQKFINSIAKQESGGNYKAVNPTSGALGKYQIMPANIASWSKSALGHSITPSQFLKNPNLQEAVAQAKLKYYFNKYGATGAAKAWYGGEGSVHRSSSAPEGNYPSLNDYAAQVTKRLK